MASASERSSGSALSELEHPVLMILPGDDQRLTRNEDSEVKPIPSTEKIFLFRTSGPSKKLGQQELPMIAFAVQHSGKVYISSTGRMVHAMCLWDGQTNFCKSFNEKHKTKFTLDVVTANLKKHQSTTKSTSMWAMVFSNVSFQVDVSHPLDCRMRAGWGTARIPLLKMKSISNWMQKRTLDPSPNESEPVYKALRQDEDNSKEVSELTPGVQVGDVKDDQAIAAATIEADTKVSSSSDQTCQTGTNKGEPTERHDGGQDQKSQETQVDVETKELTAESTDAMSEDEPRTAETNDPTTEIQPYSNEREITNVDDPESAGQTPCQVEKPIEHSEHGTGTMDTQPERSKSDVESEHQEVRAEEHHTSSRPETNESEQEPEVSAAGVRDLQDAFGWPSFVCRAYAQNPHFHAQKVGHEDDDPDRLEYLAASLGMNQNELSSIKNLIERIGMSSISTAYSGIDAPGTSILHLLAGVENEFNLETFHPEHLFAVEWNQSCQNELSIHPAKAQCIFTDIADFLHPSLRAQLPSLQAKDELNTVLMPLVRDAPKKSILKRAQCTVHGRECSIDGKVASLHCAGTTCVAFSPIGQQQGEHAMSHAHFIIWCGQRAIMGEPVVVQENVKEFPKSALQLSLPMHEWNAAILDPSSFGWPVRRERQFMIGRHRVKTLGFRSLLTTFTSMMARPLGPETSWDIFFWQDEDSDELLSELEWASQRPCSTWSQTEQGNTVPPLDDATSFFSSLTECEQKFLSCYEIKMPNGLYSLNQNPEVTNMGTNGKVMPTLVSSASIWYSSRHLRWMTPEEALTVQGFPVRRGMSFHHQCCSFAVRHDGGASHLRPPSRQNIFKMAGNSMHVNVIGIVMIYGLTQISIHQSLLDMLKEAWVRRKDPRRLRDISRKS